MHSDYQSLCTAVLLPSLRGVLGGGCWGRLASALSHSLNCCNQLPLRQWGGSQKYWDFTGTHWWLYTATETLLSLNSTWWPCYKLGTLWQQHKFQNCPASFLAASKVTQCFGNNIRLPWPYLLDHVSALMWTLFLAAWYTDAKTLFSMWGLEVVVRNPPLWYDIFWKFTEGGSIHQ